MQSKKQPIEEATMFSTFIKSSRLACLALATFLATPVFAAGPVSLLQLIQTNGSLTEGDKLFSSFGFIGDSNRIATSNIFVETVSLPGGFLGLKFSGNMSASTPSLDFALFYSVETTNGLPLISEIGQSFVMSATGNGGFVLIGETVFDQGFFVGNNVAQSSIGFADQMDPAGEMVQGDQLIINPPKSKVWVTKDINLIAADSQSSVGLSNVIQVFCQNQIVINCPTNRTAACNTPFTFDEPTATNACCPERVVITVGSTTTNQVSDCLFCATRTWVLVDGCGNTTTCAQTICFTRNPTPPLITCPPNLNLGCNPLTIPACNPESVVVTQSCGPVTITCNFVDATNGCSRTRTVFYVAVDQCTNRAACTQTITWIQDTNPPVFTLCPPDRDLGCNPNPEAIPGCNLSGVAVQDDCGPVSITCSSADTTNGCGRVRTITYVATDICTNRAVCQQRITWKVDVIPPVLHGVPTNRNFQCFSDYLALTPPVVTATDDCDGTNLVVSAISGISGTCPIIIQACWTAVDSCSNSATACVTYTIRDTIPPIIRCPTNISVGCDSNVPPCPANLAGFVAMGGFASDNCDTNLTFFCIDGPRIGNQIVRTYTVCDDCTNCASCTQVITFVGNTPPTLVCPPDLTVECSNNIPAAAANLAEFLAAGGWVSTTNLLSFTSATGPFIGDHCNGSVVRTYTITDSCSNTVSCQQRIFVRDTTPPNIHCGADKEVQCGTDWAFDLPTASDNCDGINLPVVLVSTVTNVAVPRCPRIFSVTRTWRATDSCSNSAFCNQTVTIVDTEPPNITCEQDKEELCGIAWFFDIPTAVDKCDLNNVLIEVVSTVTNISVPRCPAIFSVTRTWRATDTCGNASFCNQTVTIVDIEPPNITCEQDKEVECGTAWAFDIPTAVDKCDLNNVLIEVVATVTNVSLPRCPALFSVTRTWRATDTCGNAAFCNQTVTIVDLEPPNITCGSDKDVQCNTDWAFDIPTAVDKCDLNNVLIEVVATVTNVSVPRCPKLFSVTRTWRSTDTCGNSSFCNQTVTIVDTDPPHITCGPDKQAQCGTDWTFDIPTAVDGCDLNNVLIEVAATVTNVATARCPKVFSVSRIWRASDTCGNHSFCSQTVTIIDTLPPTLVCAQDQIVECGTPFAFTRPSAVDLCDGTNVLIEITSTVTNVLTPRCPGLFSVRRTWRASDTCNNAAFCSQTITIVDTMPPNLTCADDQIVECGTPFDFTRPTAVDACDGANVLIEIISSVTNILSPRCPGLYSVRRTWRASDSCSNQAFCSQTLTVVDTTPPNLSCADDQIVECGTPFAFTRPTAVDLCDGTNVVIEITSTVTNLLSPRCPGLYTVRRTWRAYDTCTNESFCSQTMTIVDTTPPNITCADDQQVECGTPFAFTRPTAVDVCDGTNVLIEITSTVTNLAVPSCPGMFTVRRTWRAVDTCSNESFCSQTITLLDTTPPNITCPSDVVAECSLPNGFNPPFAVDACDGTNVLITVVTMTTNTASPRCPNLFSVRVTWKATDRCGNASLCSQSIMVVDTTPPNLVCARDRQVECGLPWSFSPPSASDGCDGTNVTIVIVGTVTNTPATPCPVQFSATRTWRATDSCGNSSLCSQTIEVVDTSAPELVCASDKVVQCGLPWSFSPPFALDICDGTNVTVTIVSTVTNAQCGMTYTATRTWRAADRCGNSAVCSQSILVVDTVPPEITCAPSRILECGTPWNFTPPAANDVCDGTNVVIAIVSTITNNTCGRTFSATRTWSATDRCGNRSLCSQTISTVDTMPPVITCANDRLLECGTPWNFGAPSANDVCDGTNVTITIVSTVTNQLCGRTLSATRIWRAADQCGNNASCSQTITLVDTTPPNLTCGPNQSLECGTPFAFSTPAANDICDGTNVTVVIVGTVTNQTCGSTFSATRTWKATDACGNVANCSQTINVIDTLPPSLSCSPNRTVECGTPFTFTPPTATDSCDGTNVTITIVSTTTNGLCGNTFVAVRIWRAADRCGNASQCSQTIRVVDSEPPVLVGLPGNQSVSCFADVPPVPPVTAFDFCDTNVVPTVTITTNGRCPFIITRCWTAVDDCNNSVQGCQMITVSPPPPTVSGPTNQTICPGNPATFCAIVSSTCPATMQWYRDGTAIPGATNACYTIPNVSLADAGQYCIAVMGVCHSVTNCARLDVCMAALGDFVWNDLDQDGIQDVGEPGVPDVTVQLFDCLDHMIAAKLTDEFGGYLFTGLTAGTYRVTFIRPSGYKFTIPNVGSDSTDSDADIVTGRTGCYTLAATETNRTVDAGIFQPAALGDFVWNDFNEDGIQGPGEMGVPNVTVRLSTCAGVLLATTNTDADGMYLFTDLKPGSYKVTFVLPANFSFTLQDVGDDALDSDANVNTGMTGCYTLLPGETNRTVDAGIFQNMEMGAGGCRVTGGSNHQTNSYQSACITTPLPSHISHGGQVGAPFSVGTPFMPNSPCISGEWQHNRHLSGNSLVGTFHASGNGHEHQFDSLLCACLPCPENPNSPGLIGEICNPGDRICGPEPSKAPANKICFSGVGDYTFTNGRKTVKAVFRVDVEDRGEGNSQSSTAPPDRYRIRLWILDPSCGRNPDPNSAEAMAIRFAASADPTKINNLATTEDLKVNIQPDIDDGGNLTQGNQQIHKATGAKCKDIVPTAAAVDIDVSTLVTPQMQTVAARSYSTVAQGFQGTKDPVFVYQITITNSGTTGLRDVVVIETTDGVARDTTSLYRLGSQNRLSAGQSATRYYTNSVSADSVTMVTVSGKPSQNSTPVFATSTAVAWVNTELPLTIRPSGNNYQLQWPTAASAGFILQSTTSLKPPISWNTIATNPPNPFVITNSPQTRARFYRLRSL